MVFLLYVAVNAVTVNQCEPEVTMQDLIYCMASEERAGSSLNNSTVVCPSGFSPVIIKSQLEMDAIENSL